MYPLAKTEEKQQAKTKSDISKMGPFQKKMNDLNLTIVTAGPRGEFSRNVSKWIERISSKYADTKCDDGTYKETRALIMASVRNDCY